jgi:adenylate cyclase
MESMTQVAMLHGGVVDDYAGDGIKINFGVPLPRNSQAEINQDAVNAVKCALSMKKKVIELNEIWKAEQKPQAKLRIGIFTGPVIAAALGSTKRLKYTTIGDTVNIAARLESYDKQFAAENPCRIIVGDSTLQCLNGQFQVELIGRASLKGKEGQMRIFYILDS